MVGQADANKGHAFGILMALVGTLRTCGAPAPLTLGVRPDGIHQCLSGFRAACPSAVVRATEACGLRVGVTVAQGAVR